ncbi:hypothetical protein CsatA_023114 [Cannabis sativa]
MFSVKDAYILDQGFRFGPRKDKWKWIWDPGLHPRIYLMLWKVINDALPTAERVSAFTRFGRCFYESESEDTIHLFKECAFAKAIWFTGRFPFVVDSIHYSNIIDFVEAILSSLPGDLRKEVTIYIGCVFQAIWKCRNMVRINGCDADVTSVISEAATVFLELWECRDNDQSMVFSEFYEEEVVRSDLADHIVFTDASWKEGVGGYAVVAIHRTDNSWCYKLDSSVASCPLEAESRAVLLALELVVQNSWSRVYFLSDCRVLVKALQQFSPPPDWRFLNISLGVLDLMNVISDCKFYFIHRDSNSIADGLAKRVRLSSHESFSRGGNSPNDSRLLFFD